MANNVPQIGMTGLYKLKEPFDKLLLANVAYRCVAVRKLEDIVAAGGDPKELYYTNNSLSDTVYNTDLAAGVCIVSLQAGSGSWVYVPSSYIESMPDQGGIPYTTIVLATSLSAIPNSLDLSYLKNQIEDLVMDTLGVASTVREIAISQQQHLSQAEHVAIEAARAANIAASTTERAQRLEAERQRDAALEKIQQLEAFIKTKLTP